MARATAFDVHRRAPRAADVLELLKPVTWFPPMWAFMCGVVSSGASISERWAFLAAGVVLAGPLVCGTSQAVNDWFDRHVDAINEPGRPIPSGRIPGRWGLWIACIGTLLSASVAWLVGPWVFAATLIGLFLAWAYSAPPLRLKMSGWWGPGAVALSYEGLTWFTGAAVMLGTLPDGRILSLLLLYSIGAHGIMTLNDFKAVQGDQQLGIRSLPVLFGTKRAVLIACVVMTVPQMAVVALLIDWGLIWQGGVVAILLLGQLVLMKALVRAPMERAPWYGARGVTLYVLGMLVSAIGVGSLLGRGL